MSVTHATNAVLKIADNGAALRDFSAYLKESGFNRAVDAIESTTLGATNKTFIPGLGEASISLSGEFDATADGYLDGIRRATTTFEWYPLGTGTGKPKYAGSCILTKYEVSTPVADAVTFSAEFQVTGAVNRSLVP